MTFLKSLTSFHDLIKKTTNHILIRRLRNVKNSYTFYTQIMSQLIEIYEDFDRKINVKREYRTLMQGA